MSSHGGPAGDTTTVRKPGRRWLRWALPVVTLIIGVVIGTAAAGGDPTKSDQYQELSQKWQEQREQLTAVEGDVETAEGRADAAVESARVAGEDVSARSAELDAREAAVAAREGAVTAVEAQVAANSVGEGTWTVGVDIEPGTYRTSAAVTSQCYWG